MSRSIKKKMSLSNQVFIGLIAGILCGLFFGDMCVYLKPLGNIFIKIMQITVIPYIIVSLLYGIGGLKKELAKSIAIRGGLVLLSFWLIVIVLFFTMQLIFPEIKFASFYSSNNQNSTSINFIDLFIPSNPFSALANNAVPAIIVFCVLLGIAFINIKSEEKSIVLKYIKILSQSIEGVTGILTKIIPYGVFVITAHTAGTIDYNNLTVLSIYIIGYIICSLFIVFLVIPMITSSITKFTYYDILSEIKGVLIFVFATTNAFITLPLIVDSLKNLYAKYKKQDEHINGQIDLLVPIYYNFPCLGALSLLFFILFVAWFYNHSLTIFNQIEFGFVGVLSFFGSKFYAIPFLLKFLKLPSDAFNLFLTTDNIVFRFTCVLSVMGWFACTLVCTSFYAKFFKIQILKLVKSIILLSIIFIILISGLRFLFSKTFSDLYKGDEQLKSMILPKTNFGKNYTDIVLTKVYKQIPKHLLNIEPDIDINYKEETLSRIKQRKILRVGYNANAMPFNFFNIKGDLVGYDIQMAYELAIFLSCKNIEFIPVQYSEIDKMLNSRICDIIMATVTITPERMSNMMFSSSYQTQTLSFIVKDYREKEFSTVKSIKNIKSFKIANLHGSAFISIAQNTFPNAEIIETNNLNDFFNKNIADAMFIAAEEGFAWTLLYPYYTVAMFTPNENFKFPVAYPIASRGGESFRLLLNAWLEIIKAKGLLNRAYNYWVMGKKEAEDKGKRWSVLKNVLHFTD